MIANLFATFAVRGRCSEMRMPETLVAMGLKGLRYRVPASGLGSNVSSWLMPPVSQRWIMEMSRFAATGDCARSRRTSP